MKMQAYTNKQISVLLQSDLVEWWWGNQVLLNTRQFDGIDQSYLVKSSNLGPW